MRLELTYTQPQLDIFFGSKARRVIIPKGRRFGATRGAAHACIEWSLEGMPILWGDTVHGNIERYWERYFQPALRASNIDGRLDKISKVARIGSGYIDFRSADRPENWEGFGYRKTILNEAGIILQNPYIYTNAVLPMLADYPDSELFALGVPKGRELRDGRMHPFYMLWCKAEAREYGFWGKRYSSYDNKLLSAEQLAELEDEIRAMDPTQVDQEIYGQFIQPGVHRPFAFNFSEEKHVVPCAQQARHVYIAVDFNVEPFCLIYAHIWQDHAGHHVHIIGEESIGEATMEEMARRIRARVPVMSSIYMTGDRGGTARRLGLRSNASMFDDLIRLCGIYVQQLKLPANPTHIQSRDDVNYLFAHHPDLRIDPSCKNLIRDLRVVGVDEYGSIIKKDRSIISQQADLLDCLRYLFWTYLSDWKKTHTSRHVLPGHRQV